MVGAETEEIPRAQWELVTWDGGQPGKGRHRGPAAQAGAWWSAAGAACGPRVLQWHLASDLKELRVM